MSRIDHDKEFQKRVVEARKPKTPLKAIRLKCLDCCGDSSHHVRLCPAVDCPLWKFRLGKHPYTEKNKNSTMLDTDQWLEWYDLTTEELNDKLKELRL